MRIDVDGVQHRDGNRALRVLVRVLAPSEDQAGAEQLNVPCQPDGLSTRQCSLESVGFPSVLGLSQFPTSLAVGAPASPHQLHCQLLLWREHYVQLGQFVRSGKQAWQLPKGGARLQALAHYA